MNLLIRLCQSIAELVVRLLNLQLGLKATMTLLSVVGMIALITIFGVLAIAAARETTDRALQERVVIAQIAANHADYVLSNVRSALQVIAARPLIRQSDAPRAARENELRDALTQPGFPAHQILMPC